MSAKVSSIEKFKDFSADKPYATVRFVAANGGSKFAAAAFGTNTLYSLTYDLSLAYGDDEDCKNDEGKFSPKKAYSKFTEEMPIGSVQEDVNCFEIPISEISQYEKVQITATKREMKHVRVATYANRDRAVEIAKNGLKRQLENKTLKAVTKEDEEEED